MSNDNFIFFLFLINSCLNDEFFNYIVLYDSIHYVFSLFSIYSIRFDSYFLKTTFICRHHIQIRYDTILFNNDDTFLSFINYLNNQFFV